MVGFPTAGYSNHTGNPHSTATVFNLTNAAVGEPKSRPGLLSLPDMPAKRKNFLNDPHAVLMKLEYFQVDI